MLKTPAAPHHSQIIATDRWVKAHRHPYKMHINELPVELLAHIFSLIDDLPARIDLELVCRHWSKVALTNSWIGTRSCRFSIGGNSSGSYCYGSRTLLSKLGHRCGQWLEELRLENVDIGRKLAASFVNTMPRLRHLDLRFCKINLNALRSIESGLGPELRSLMLYETSYNAPMCQLLANTPKLEHLSLHLGYDHTNGTVPTRLPTKLKTFAVDTWYEYHADLSQLLTAAARDCQELKFLHVEVDKIEGDLIDIVSRMKSLCYLRLATNSLDSEQSLERCLFHLPSLRALSLGCCTQQLLMSIGQLCPNLIHLRIELCHFSSTNLSPLQLIPLRSLVLRSSTNADSRNNYLNLFTNFQSDLIEHLDIRSLPSIYGLIWHLMSRPNLTCLHIKISKTTSLLFRFCKEISNYENAILLKERKNRLILWLWEGNFCSKITFPDDIALLKKGWLPNKRRLPSSSKKENAVLEEMIAETIGRETPHFLFPYWLE